MSNQMTKCPCNKLKIGESYDGEIYAGLMRGTDGDYHLMLSTAESKLTWNEAKKWAAGLGRRLPTRKEQALLFANLSEHFESEWYWSSEQHASRADFAWVLFFGDGYRIISYKSNECRVVAVRRKPIQQLNN